MDTEIDLIVSDDEKIIVDQLINIEQTKRLDCAVLHLIEYIQKNFPIENK